MINSFKTQNSKLETRLILIRHGQTKYNQASQYQGHLDNPLNEEGLDQAKSLANALSDRYEIDAIYCSPLKRAMQTAEEIAKIFNRKHIIFNDLIELDFGKWDGLTYDEIAKDHPIKQWYDDPSSVDIKDGEKWLDFSLRVKNAFTVLSSLELKTIAIVSHAGVIRNYLASILGVNGLDMFKFGLENGSFSEILVKGGGNEINFINETQHINNIKVSSY